MACKQQRFTGMTLTLPDRRARHWQDALADLLDGQTSVSVTVDAGDWVLGCRDLQQLLSLLHQEGHVLDRLTSRVPETVVSACSLGLDAALCAPEEPLGAQDRHPSSESRELLVHQGTLRSGDHLESERSILLYGDVNPGARISSAGDVFVWGRLRGVAHAGCNGSTSARIVALQLRPLQLRIADLVARGPDELPQTGLAEQACLQDGSISIEPAQLQRPPRP